MSLRRQPQQSRSRERVESILDAADQVFLEMGYEAATTNHVAARAGVSVGGLYRFFPDKEALLVALAERYASRMRALGEGLPPPTGLTLAEHVSLGVRAFNELLVAWPGFRTLIEQARHPALAAGMAAESALMAGLIGATLARVAPTLADEDRAAISEVTNLVLGTLQGLSVSRDAAFRARVVREAEILVTAYLSRRLGIPEDAVLG